MSLNKLSDAQCRKLTEDKVYTPRKGRDQDAKVEFGDLSIGRGKQTAPGEYPG